MKDLLDQMEEHIAAIRNLQRNFDFHSKRLEKLMLSLNQRHQENNKNDNPEMTQTDIEKK
jgi:hypothetical protein